MSTIRRVAIKHC